MGLEFIKNKNIINTVIDGEVVFSERVYHENQSLEDIDEPSLEVIMKILNLTVDELPKTVTINGGCNYDSLKNLDWLTITKRAQEQSMYLSYSMSLEEWNQPFSPKVYVDYIESEYNMLGELEDGRMHVGKTVTLQNNDLLLDVYNVLAEQLHTAHSGAFEYLSKMNVNKHLLKIFKFPSGYQNICSQYLVWFGEFLENFGINALVSVNQENDETQIVVSSEHTEQMFQEIETLFSQYIALPYAEFLPAPSQTLAPEQQFMVTQLQSQVTMFKTQLEMKSSAIQLKEATIQGLQNTIQTQQNTIDVQNNQLLLIESMQGDDEVELFGGIVKLGEIEWGPIKISPKSLVDKLKEK